MTATTVTIQSFTDPNKCYTLKVSDRDGFQIATCNCPTFTNRHECKHATSFLQTRRMLASYAENWRGNAVEVGR